MTKTIQRQRKKKRLAQERAAKPVAKMPLRPMFFRELTPEEIESDRLVDERLLSKFGPKDQYTDHETTEAIEELEAEGALPDLTHLD